MAANGCGSTPSLRRNRATRPIDEPADTVEHCRIDTCATLDQAIERDAGVAMIVAQTKTANHGCENISPAYCRSSGFLFKLSDQPDAHHFDLSAAATPTTTKSAFGSPMTSTTATAGKNGSSTGARTIHSP